MKATEFKIATRSDAAKFDRLLNQYRLEQHIHEWSFIYLEETFIALEEHQKPAHFFSAFFDVCLQDVALQRDLKIIQDETNREYSGGDTNIEGVFSPRMERYIAASNAALRLRAMWDKVMGLKILLYCPDKYQNFLEGNSRLKTFKKIVRARKMNPEDKQNELIINKWNEKLERSIDQLEKIVREIDNNFRTAEAHMVGRIGKWAFVKQEDEDDPFEKLLLANADIYEHLRGISSVLRLRLYTGRK